MSGGTPRAWCWATEEGAYREAWPSVTWAPGTTVTFSEFPAVRLALPSYTTVDLSLEGGLLLLGGLPEVRPLLRIENLLDREYQQIVNFPARPRTLFVGAPRGGPRS